VSHIDVAGMSERLGHIGLRSLHRDIENDQLIHLDSIGANVLRPDFTVRQCWWVLGHVGLQWAV
jgi:hypothetical protein